MTTANLSIEDNDTVDQYTSVGESDFTFNFPILDASELKVSINQALLVYGVDYSLNPSSLANPAGGSIHTTVATTVGQKVTLWLDMPIVRESGFQGGAATLLPEDLNADAVQGLRIDQQLRRDIGRCLAIPVDDPVAGQGMTLPIASQRLNKLVYFNPVTGKMELLALTSISGITTAVSLTLLANLLNPRTQNEIDAGAVVVNAVYLEGVVDRYGSNLVPGTTDMSLALQAAVNVALVARGIGKAGVPVRFLASAYKIVTPPTYGANNLMMKPLDIGGAGNGTQVINAAGAGKATFDLTNVSGFYLHDLLLTGNSANKNDGILVAGAANIAIRWRIERVVSMMAGRGIVLNNVNTGVIRDFKHWPDNGDQLLTIAQVVVTTDIDHGIFATGNYAHDITIYDADCFPRGSFKAAAAGIRWNTAFNSYGVRIFGSMVQGSAGDAREGIFLSKVVGFSIHGTYHESSRIRLNNATAGSISGTNTGGVGGIIQLEANSQNNVIHGCACGILQFDDVTCTGNSIISCDFPVITDAAKPANRYSMMREGPGFIGATRGGEGFTTLAYSAAMTPDRDVSSKFNIVPNNAVAFTVNEPLHPMDGDEVTIKIRNATGGALGALTWGAQYKAATTTQPANGFSITRRFTHDKSYGSGVLWIQTGADVTTAN